MNTKITKRRIWSRNNIVIRYNRYHVSLLHFAIALSILAASPVLLQIATPQAFAAVQIVTIPYGAFDPNFNTAAPQWYLPTAITIQVNQTVKWINQDTEGHTVTSGKAGGREGLVQNNMGLPSGFFDSGTIPPGKTWSYTFTKPGQYEYFCTIHPWMDGYITVNEVQPDPTDADGKKLTQFPLVRLTPDRRYEVDLSWEPHYVMTGHKIILVYQVYDNVNPHPISAHYLLTIMQNGQQLYRYEDKTEFGGGYTYFTFNEPGPAIFRFDNIDNTDQSVQYSLMVEQMNSSMGNMAGMDDMVQPARNLTLQNLLLPLFFTPAFITAGVVIFLVKIRKQKSHGVKSKSAI